MSGDATVNKIVSASEFKATCLKLIDEMNRTGQPVTITRRGKVVAEMTPKGEEAAKPARTIIGSMKGSVTILGDIVGPIDPDWEVEWDAKWDEKLRGDPLR